MKQGSREEVMRKVWIRKRIWVILVAACAVILAVWVHLVGFLQIELSIPTEADWKRPTGFAMYSDSRREQTDPVLREQALLLDSASLFLPTRWNSASNINHVASLREETELFIPFAPMLNVNAEEMPPKPLTGERLKLSGLIEGPRERDLRAMGLGESPLRGIRPRETQAAGHPVRNLHLRAFELQSGQSLWLDPGETEIGSHRDELWEPATLHIQILWGRPLGTASVSISSGYSTWDRYLQELSESAAIYSRLKDGYWRLEWLP